MSLSSFTAAVGTAMPTLLVLLKATAILLAALAVTLALHRSSASTRYVVWLFSLAGLLALPGIATLSPVRLPILPAAATATPLPNTNLNAVQLNAPQQGLDNAGPTTAFVPNGSAAQLAEPVANPPHLPLGMVLLGLWATVTVLLLARLLHGVYAVRRIVRRAQPMDAPEWQDLLYQIADRLGIDEAPALLKSSDNTMPFAAGIRRPTIVLPADCETWTPAQRDAVLIHELGHVRRHDMIGHTLGRIACAVYWFHPLVWTAARRLRDASERACDDLALRLGARPSDYAQHLLNIVTTVRQPNTPSAAIAMARRKEFEGRMLAILDPALHRNGASRWRTVMLSGTLSAFVFAVSAAAPAPRATAPVTATTAENGTENTEPAPVTEETLVPGTSAALAPAEEPVTRQPVAASSDQQEEQSLAVLDRVIQQAVPTLERFVERTVTNVSVNLFSDPGVPDDEKRDLLIRILRTDSAASVRRVAAWGLQRYAADPAAQTVLARSLVADNDGRVRRMSAWALAHSLTPLAVEALGTAFTSDQDEDVRETAVWGLGTCGDVSAVETIGNRLGFETSDRVRSTAAWALGRLRGRSAPPSLINLLGDADRTTRLRAAWALSEIGDKEALPAILRATEQPQDDATMRALLRALVRSGASTEQLSTFLTSSNAQVRAIAVRSLTGSNAIDPWPWPWPRPIPVP
jgi:beta-lactamase regulating signal transducer with metallopeptidase domain/HEAT repeat protein